MTVPARPSPRPWYGQLWDAARALEQYAFRQVPGALLILIVWGAVFAGGPAQTFLDTRDLRAHGHPATADQVQVNVSADACRSPRCITDVRAHVPGRPGWLVLRGPDVPLAVVDDHARTGWQPATADSGYQAPLPVMIAVRPDGRADAASVADLDDVTSPGSVGWFAAGVLLLLTTVSVAVVWVRRFAALPAPRLKSWRRLRNT